MWASPRDPSETFQGDLGILWRVTLVDLQISFPTQLPMSLVWMQENFRESLSIKRQPFFFLKKKKKKRLVVLVLPL